MLHVLDILGAVLVLTYFVVGVIVAVVVAKKKGHDPLAMRRVVVMWALIWPYFLFRKDR